MNFNPLYYLISHTEDYRVGCEKAYVSHNVTDMLEDFYLWILAHTARSYKYFSCKPESWWEQEAEKLFRLLEECRYAERLDELKASVMELQEAGIRMDLYLNVFPNLEWDMDFLMNDCHALVVEVWKFYEEYSPDNRRLVRGKAILSPIREQMEEFAYAQTPLTFVYWWAAWFYSDKENCLQQVWWDSFKECTKWEMLPETLEKISKLTVKDGEAYVYGLERSIYEDGKTFPFPEYPLDLAKRYVKFYK